MLPVAPKTPLCLFVNTYLKDDPKVKANPKLFDTFMPPEEHYFRCTNYKGTKFNIDTMTRDATDMVSTPFANYVELNAYLNKMGAIFQKEVLSKVGKK